MFGKSHAFEQEEVAKKRLEKSLKGFREMELEEFRNYLHSPMRIFWSNFMAGTARGLGFFFGAAIVVTTLGYVITEWLAHIPIIGDFFLAIEKWIEATLQAPR